VVVIADRRLRERSIWSLESGTVIQSRLRDSKFKKQSKERGVRTILLHTRLGTG
jgi:hypothetical protein